MAHENLHIEILVAPTPDLHHIYRDEQTRIETSTRLARVVRENMRQSLKQLIKTPPPLFREHCQPLCFFTYRAFLQFI